MVVVDFQLFEANASAASTASLALPKSTGARVGSGKPEGLRRHRFVAA